MFIPVSKNVLDPRVDVYKLDLKDFPDFERVYASCNADTFTFATFDTAYLFGKRLATENGFQIRIKTTGFNRKEGIIYKYICCQKQGRPEHGWKPKDGAARKRKRDSVRCDCKWTCKLMGIKTSARPASAAEFTELHERDTDLLWYYDRADKGHAHNHTMESGVPANNARSSSIDEGKSPRSVNDLLSSSDDYENSMFKVAKISNTNEKPVTATPSSPAIHIPSLVMSPQQPSSRLLEAAYALANVAGSPVRTYPLHPVVVADPVRATSPSTANESLALRPLQLSALAEKDDTREKQVTAMDPMQPSFKIVHRISANLDVKCELRHLLNPM